MRQGDPWPDVTFVICIIITLPRLVYLNTLTILQSTPATKTCARTKLHPKHCELLQTVACENIRFSMLFAAGEVSHGGTSATQRQKFHTDEVKYVQNPVRSPDWSTEQLHCFSYRLRMTDKRQKATKVKCKRDRRISSKTINICGIYSSLEEAFEFCWSSLADEHNNLPKSTRRNVKLDKFVFGTL